MDVLNIIGVLLLMLFELIIGEALHQGILQIKTKTYVSGMIKWNYSTKCKLMVLYGTQSTKPALFLYFQHEDVSVVFVECALLNKRMPTFNYQGVKPLEVSMLK